MSDKIKPCLWFDGNAEEAIDFYISVIAGSSVVSASRYGEGAPLPAGTVMTIDFRLAGRDFMAINGGPQFRFSPAVSMMIGCDTQEEIDRLWDTLSEGGETQACGWLVDRYGLSWQVVPSILGDLMSGDAAQCDRVMQALWGMAKLDIAALKAAAASAD